MNKDILSKLIFDDKPTTLAIDATYKLSNIFLILNNYSMCEECMKILFVFILSYPTCIISLKKCTFYLSKYLNYLFFNVFIFKKIIVILMLIVEKYIF